jgi:predicted alpha/beta superfamily hydrolase
VIEGTRYGLDQRKVKQDGRFGWRLPASGYRLPAMPAAATANRPAGRCVSPYMRTRTPGAGRRFGWRSLIVAVLATLALSALATALVGDHLSGRQTQGDGVVVSVMRSEVLGEDREAIVHLPESYVREPGRRYPVIYVLDGSSQDGHTARSAALMARIGAMPEVIVVGLPNVSGTGRQRDYTPPFMAQDLEQPDSPRGAADRFLAFLGAELIPTIERDYRTAPFRMLAGHSRGALLVAYSLMADPPLFQARFAHSPALWREENILVDRLGAFLESLASLEGFFYMSIGSEENDKMMAAFEQARSVLARTDVPGFRWRADVVAGADHQTNGEMATPLGLSALYRDFSTSPAHPR